MEDDKKTNLYFKHQKQQTKWEGFKEFLWNSETHQFLGRTGTSWIKIFVFYVIFYVCLAAFFAILLFIFYQTLDSAKPKWDNETGSIIGNNPGIGFRPKPPQKRVESTLIWFKRNEENDYSYWVANIEDFLKPYEGVKDTSGENFATCDYNKPPGKNKFCQFEITKLGDLCTKEQKFGYDNGYPCVVIKMNKVYGWSPEVYTNASALPKAMPDQVKTAIQDNFADSNGTINKQNVWFSCEGENPADKENIGPIDYYPHPGFPYYYFPYTNVPGYLSPLVAVRFKKPLAGVLINIECKIWAKNVKNDRANRYGSVHFELMMD